MFVVAIVGKSGPARWFECKQANKYCMEKAEAARDFRVRSFPDISSIATRCRLQA